MSVRRDHNLVLKKVYDDFNLCLVSLKIARTGYGVCCNFSLEIGKYYACYHIAYCDHCRTEVACTDY